MAKRKSSDYRREASNEPFELELDSGEIIVFKDPGQLETESVWALARTDSLEYFFQAMLSPEDHEKWWAEWRKRPQVETAALQADVMAHFRSQSP